MRSFLFVFVVAFLGVFKLTSKELLQEVLALAGCLFVLTGLGALALHQSQFIIDDLQSFLKARELSLPLQYIVRYVAVMQFDPPSEQILLDIGERVNTVHESIELLEIFVILH